MWDDLSTFKLLVTLRRTPLSHKLRLLVSNLSILKNRVAGVQLAGSDLAQSPMLYTNTVGFKR